MKTRRFLASLGMTASKGKKERERRLRRRSRSFPSRMEEVIPNGAKRNEESHSTNSFVVVMTDWGLTLVNTFQHVGTSK